MSNILIDYDKNKIKYEAFSKTLASLIDNLMLTEDIKVHSVTYRVKDRGSLEKKLKNKDKYNNIEDITDIVGLRIITHFSDEVDVIANLIEKEFLVDKENTIDKRASLEPEKFGYLSLHYVISLPDSRVNLFEYKTFKGIKAEIQIRSILQHTWAEIEHDIGYKSSVEVPKVIKRQFSRLAGLLELADQEFLSIKTSLQKYQSTVEKTVWSSRSEDYKIDKITLREFLKASSLIQEIRRTIEQTCEAEFAPDIDYDGPAINYLSAMHIDSIKDLENQFKSHKDLVIKRATWVVNKYHDSFAKNRSLEILAVYLAQVMAYEKGGIEELDKLLLKVFPKYASSNYKDFLDDFAHSLDEQGEVKGRVE